MNALVLLAAAVITAQPIAGPDALEPSVENEVRHTLKLAGGFNKQLDTTHEEGDDFVDGLLKGLSASDAAIRLVSSFDARTGVWRRSGEGVTNHYTIAAMKRLNACLGVKPLRVLCIGNSFTLSLQGFWPNVARECGTPLQYAIMYIGGCELARHARNIDIAATNACYRPYAIYQDYCGRRHAGRRSNIQEMLAAEKWDVVTIQQASHESWRWESYPRPTKRLVEKIRELAPQARIVVQQTWSYANTDGRIRDPKTGGPGTWGFDQTGMYDRLARNYDRIAGEYGFEVIRTGEAVQRYRALLPVADPKDDVVGAPDDPIHLNHLGEFLQALVWQRFFFPESDCRACIHPGDGRLRKVSPRCYETLGACLK